jgi:hypothetical protein
VSRSGPRAAGDAVRGGPFAPVRAVGLALPGVECATKYDGSPLLRIDGAFMAGLAMHATAEPGSLVVRVDIDDRQLLLDEAPDVYYLTDYYRPHPVVLVRLARVDREALRDLLAVSRRLTLAKTRKTPASPSTRGRDRARRDPTSDI